MIPVHLIKEYHFCPRVVYYSLLTNIKPIMPRHVSFGNDYHDLQRNLDKHRRFKKLKIDFDDILYESYLEDDEIGICGKVDLAFLTSDEVIPVEFKFINSKKPTYAHILQLYGYGILLESKYKKEFKQAYIIYSKNIKFFKIEITSEIKNDFFKTLKNINDLLDNGYFPDSSSQEEKCIQCVFLNFCNDRF